MNKTIHNQFIFFFLFILSTVIIAPDKAFAGKERAIDRSVLLSAYVTKEPKPAITIRWKAYEPNVKSYTISRKRKDWGNWSILGVVKGDATSYRDTTVEIGTGYEYRVRKAVGISPDDNSTNDLYVGYGYIYCGIDLPEVDFRGKVLLLVDKTVAVSLKDELKQYKEDLTGDGWNVVMMEVPRSEYFNPAAVESVKRRIRKVYIDNPGGLKSVILLGRVPVPYSGSEAFDGHPEHTGAWPADVYYASMDGEWSDTLTYAVSGDRKENHNVPLDGKLDQSRIPGQVDLQLGRIDMHNIVAFKKPEVELLRNYLKKNHHYRQYITQTRYRAIIDDKWSLQPGDGVRYSGAMAWMNFSALLGPEKIDSGRTLSQALDTEEYLWSYGGYMGGYTSVQETIYSQDLPNMNANGVFNVLFGSWLADWDFEDNILRAVIASNPTMLTSCFAGYPHWFFHHMGLGETIGYSTMLSQNNNGTVEMYRTNEEDGLRGIHMSIMGDPTLRMYMFSPPGNVKLDYYNRIDESKVNMKFSWDRSIDDVIGYIIFRADSLNGTFTRLNDQPVTETSYLDEHANPKGNVYMVRALKLEITPSGSFYNMSQGAFFYTDSILASVEDTPTDGIMLSITPNPSSKESIIRFDLDSPANVNIDIYSLSGNIVRNLAKQAFDSGSNFINWNLTGYDGNRLAPGIYMIKFTSVSKTQVVKFIINP